MKPKAAGATQQQYVMRSGEGTSTVEQVHSAADVVAQNCHRQRRLKALCIGRFSGRFAANRMEPNARSTDDLQSSSGQKDHLGKASEDFDASDFLETLGSNVWVEGEQNQIRSECAARRRLEDLAQDTSDAVLNRQGLPVTFTAVTEPAYNEARFKDDNGRNGGIHSCHKNADLIKVAK